MSIEFIEYARFEINRFWSYRRENCEPFCFSCNLSSFISKFQRLHIRALCNFFGQEDRRPPKSECARTPMLVRIKKLLKEKVFPSVALSESVNNLVHTVNNNFVPIRALNAHDSEAVQPILPHRAPKGRSSSVGVR